MIELERIAAYRDDVEVWADSEFSHVIAEETENTYRYGSGGPGWYVRDENGETGPYVDLPDAFTAARARWGEVTLAPANRLALDLAEGRPDEAGQFLLEYLAEYGTAGIDPQALAVRALERIGADEED